MTPEARGYLCCSQHTSGGLESKACSMLRQTIHMLRLWEGDIKRDALWAIGLAVCVALEGFLPPPFRIALLQSLHVAWTAVTCGNKHFTHCISYTTYGYMN